MSDQVQRVQAIAIDGTSATAMLVDGANGTVIAPVKLYNEAQGAAAVTLAKVRQAGQGRPADHAARLIFTPLLHQRHPA